MAVPAVTSIPAYQPMPYTIHPLPLWTVEAPGQGLFTYLVDIAATLNAAGYVWYIEGLDVDILVDGGDTAAGMQAHAFPALPIPPETDPAADPVTPALADLGLTPEDIDIVILTHLHFDHCALSYLFTNAKFVVQRTELMKALYDPPTATKVFYDTSLFEDLDFMVVDGDVMVAEGVWAIYTPGHSPGGQSVVVDTEEGRVIICGLCACELNFEPPEPYCFIWPVITPGIHCDCEQAYASLLRIKTMADIVVTLHDAKYVAGEPIP